jgi:glucose-6-phosphate dehydrogenase assembly protein OpcA
MPAVSDALWSAQDTKPSAVEAALRDLLAERHAESANYVPARVLNLVCIVEREWSGEIANRLSRVGEFHASRTIVCAVEARRTTIDAVVTLAADEEPEDDRPAPLRETVVLTVGPQHLDFIDTILDPLVVPDLPTVVWAPHGHQSGIEAMRPLAQVVLLDSIEAPEVEEALTRARSLADELYVVDMAWLRTTPWRERIAATFDPLPLRPDLRTISAVTVRHQPDSTASGLLLVGWLASRLGWKATGPLMGRGDTLRGRATTRRQDIDIRLEAVNMPVRGLEGITVETASGRHLSLDRGRGGLRAHYRNAKRDIERSWTVLGASRGEGGILGNAIRHALVRDPTYLPALEAAVTMAP